MQKYHTEKGWGYWRILPWLLGCYRVSIETDNYPTTADLKLFPRMARYNSDQSREATEAYAAIAAKHNLTLTQLSLAFVTDRPFVTSNIIGATTMAQLQENISLRQTLPFHQKF
jgi:aryl-alcohol dehydrogenase-like predicted oxidoreductase